MHIGQLKGYGLMVCYFGSKGLTFFGILLCKFVSPCGYSQSLGCDTNSTAGQGFHGKFKTKSVFAYSIFLWHFHIIEVQRMGVTTTYSQFILFRTNFKTIHAFFYNQGVDSLMPFIPIRLCNY